MRLVNVRSRATWVGLVLAASAVTGCTPDFDIRLSRVDEPRVLAIAASPAEQAPGEEVALELLFASPDESAPPPFDWAFCTARKPLSEPGAVTPDCLSPSNAALAPLGAGAAVTGLVPADTCRVFGPDPPEITANEPAGRAADPDLSGGYHQPVRVRVSGPGGDTYVTGAVRIACGLPGATPGEALEMTRRYRRNERPAVAALTLDRGGVEEEVAAQGSGDPPIEVRAGETLTWRARWPACPVSDTCGDAVCGIDEDATACAADCATPAGCAGAERYVFFDPEAREVRDRREAIQISWYSTSGTFDFDRTGRSEDEAEATSDNGWTAPSGEGDVDLWIVIRDDRGGTGWQRYRVRVTP